MTHTECTPDLKRCGVDQISRLQHSLAVIVRHLQTGAVTNE